LLSRQFVTTLSLNPGIHILCKLIPLSPSLTKSVTWSLCPLKRYSPVSPTTSQMMMSVSLEPEPSKAPEGLKRSALTPDYRHDMTCVCVCVCVCVCTRAQVLQVRVSKRVGAWVCPCSHALYFTFTHLLLNILQAGCLSA